MDLVASYIAGLLLFLVLDLVWIKQVMRPMFERHLGDIMLDDPRVLPAAAFFVLYQAGLFYLAVMPAIEAGSWHVATLQGALLGLIAYGTYEATNLATLKRWTPMMLAVDVAWGVFTSAATATAAYLTWRALN